MGKKKMDGSRSALTALAALVLALLLVGCADETPKDVEPGTPAEWQVRKVFEVEGCAVYQFRDWNTHYLTICPGAVSSIQRSGKVTRSEENPTVAPKAAKRRGEAPCAEPQQGDL